MNIARVAAWTFAASVGLLGCGSDDDGSGAGGRGGTGGGGSGAGGAGGGGTGGGGTGGGGTGGSTGGAGGSGATTGGSGGAGASGGAGGVGGAVGTGGVEAVPVANFLNSIGVCTHIGQGVDDAARSAAALTYAGIRNIRDDGRPERIEEWIRVYELSGVRTALLTNHDVTETIDMAKRLHAAGALLAVEGPNEPNNWPVTYENQTSGYETTFLPVARLQRDLYAAVKAEPSLAGIPVFHSSEAGGSEPDNVGLQFLTIPEGAGIDMPDGTKYADFANTHNYVCGHSSELVDNVCWNATDPTLNGDWDGLYVEYGRTWHRGFAGYSNDDLATLPRVSTETGWVTEGSDDAISQEQQGRIFLNLYLAGFARGWTHTFIYMLRDDPVQGYWGLFDTDYEPKRSGTYLHNMTAILADTGSASGTPGRLAYAIANQPATVHDLLLQKSTGTFELVVWNERPSGGSDDVTVSLGGAFETVKIYDPTTGTDPVETLTDADSVDLTLTDYPMIIEI
jgi:hypothetical protein